MNIIPTTITSTAAGFDPGFDHVATRGDRHSDLLCCVAIVARTTLEEVFKKAEALGMPKDGPYYSYITEDLLASIGASFGLVFTVWKEVAKAANLPDLSIALVRYDAEWEVGSSVVIHRAKLSHDGKILQYAIDPAAVDSRTKIRTDIDKLAPAWYIGIHPMKAVPASK